MSATQVTEAVYHLKAGSAYLFDHQRKGPFVARFKGTKPTHLGDPDPFFIEVDIYTEDGSGQERLANTFARDAMGRKMRPAYEGRLLRPSLINSITAPSTSVQKDLQERFARIREDARKKAEELNLPEPVLPALSLPTKQALDKIGFIADAPTAAPKKTSYFVPALGAGLAGAAAILAHLLGVY